MNNSEKKIFLKKYSTSENGKIAIFGAGAFGKKLYKWLKILGFKQDMFLDNNPALWGNEIISGIICEKPQNILESTDEILIIISIQNSPEVIKEDLLGKGFKHIILFRDIENEINKKVKEINIDLISYMAESGEGTNKCLQAGFLPVPVHFYQPVPDIQNLERREVWSKVSRLDGIKWVPDKFIENLCEISKFQPKEIWFQKPTKNKMDFCLENNCFSYICASFLYGMVSKNKPKRIIEIGSGNSSKVIFKALSDIGGCVNYTIIDPYCTFEENQFAPFDVKIMRVPVEETDISLFKELMENDILFIDSSHTVRIGGDVNFEILDVLPILAPGVTIHFHDITLPYEYPKVYAVNPAFRVFWTESYLLQAFLAFNPAFEIMLPAAYLCREYLDMVKQCYPDMKNPVDWSSGSFWIRRIK
jgi:hypothetical protein